MAEPGPQTAPQEKRPLDPRRVWSAVILAGAVTIALLIWIQGARAAAARREAFGRGVDGLAAALAYPVLESKSERFQNRATRLQLVVESVQRAGRYSLVLVTDPEGNVLASTDTSLRGQTVKELSRSVWPAETRDVPGATEAVVSIRNDGGADLGRLKLRAPL